ncbi:MAG: hypothetical protein RLZZ297_774, partial [Chloroflexota bacterium]
SVNSRYTHVHPDDVTNRLGHLMRQRRTVLMVLNSIVLLAVVSVGLLTAMQHVVSPAERVTTAWQLARLSGSYAFRSEITQTTPLEPRLSNAGRHSTVAHYLVSGSVDESNQRVVLRIENADNTAPPLEIQRDHRKTYTRQPDGTWRELPNAQDVTMTDSLAYLAGVEHITAAASGSEYAFDFNGTVFADALRQSLQANAARGVTVNSEWTSITDGAMLRGTTGTGALVVDSDGLPQTLRMDLAIPQGGDEQVVRAQIVTTYTAFARTGIALKRLYNSPQQQLAQFFPGLTANDVVYRLWSVLAILTFVLLALVLYTWRGQIASRMSLVLVVLLVSAPLVNAPRSASAAERPQPNTRDTRAPQTIASDFDPRIPADQQASGFTLPPAGTQTAPANSASNGRSRSSSRAASSVDSDSDGLSDDQEYQIGTSLMLADTDIDGITDYVEVRIPSRNLAPTASLRPTTYAQIGTLLYTNPLSDDTNGDGMSDGVECPQHMILDQTSAETQIADCSDTDGDKVPDFLTADNDGDGVADSADSDPTVALYADATTKAGFSSTNPFLLRFDGLTPNKPVVVDLQFRPTLTRLLNADTAVYDWPSGDTAGQIQRTKDTTLAAPDDAAITAIGDASAGNGDVSVAAMLEIRVPVSATNYGVLPVKTDTAWSTGTNGIPTWLDTTKFAPYGINAVWSSTGKEVVLTIPVRQNRDENGTVTSLSATAFFETPAAEWLNPASVRLLWVVSMLQDSCPAASGNCTDTHRVQSLTPVQTYYSDYLITGLEAKEHNGYTAALIYDDPQSALQTSTNKYLFLSQAQRVVANAFVEDGYLSISDSARPTRALDQILDGSNNTSATLAPALTAYGATAGTTRISTYSYRTDLASMLVRTDELKKVLDTTACRTAASVTSCETDTNKQTILNGCKTDVVSLRCNPAVMIASESKSRSASLTDYVNNSVISFKEIEFSVTRAVETSLYAVSADGNWIANDSNSLASTSVYIQSTVSRPTLSFSNLDSDTVAKLTDTAGTWLLAEMLTPVTRTYNGITVPSPTSPASMIIGNSQPSVNWSSHHANILKVNEVAIALSIAKVKKSAGAQTLREFTKEYGTSAEAKALGALAKSISDLYGPQSEYNLADMSVSTDTQRAVLQGVTTYLAVLKVGLFVKSYKEMKNLQATAAAINKLQTFYKLNPPKGMVAGVKAFREISYLKSVKFSAKVGNAVAVLSVGATWAMAGVALASAKHDYERGNIIAGAIGETASTVLLAVLSATGPVGAAIGAVIGAIDALAAAICAALDESTTRSTAGQFLCGGISGLLSKVFTVYNSSLSVDPTDSYSFDSNQINNDAGLDDPGAGFTVGNGYHTSFTTRDFMEKMPLPAQFSSLYWFAQWDDIDVRDASFAYALGNTMQYTLLSTVSAGSQAKEWKFSSLLPAPVSGSAKNENHLSWGKDFAVPQYSTPLTTSGINVKLRDLIYTKANVIPAQTCYMTWAFGWPVSYCEIENHSDIDQTNLNDDDATSFDIFPATIDGFTALRPKNGDASGTTGYTFAWSNDTDALSFPAFRDADNDGLTLVQEKEYKTSDSLSDTDDDGISDQVEIGMGYPPTVVDGDHDGLTDYQESYYKTSPTMPDTDGDGLMDGAEVVRVEGGVRKGGWDVTYAIVETVPHMTWTGSDPLKADADGDGIVDQREKILGWSPYAKNDPGIISTGGSVQETTVQVASVSQSSTMEPFENSNYNAEAAVDGNTDGTVSRVSTSTAVTRNERNPWWQAKLATPTDIESITIYNTTGTGSSSISSGLVFLSDTDLGTSTLTETLKTTARAWRTVTCNNTNPCSTTATARHTVTFSPPVSAQYVRIQLQQSGQLMLSEVVINDGVVNDMVVRPGDTIVAQATVTNKLLGRNQRGSVTFVPDAMQTNLTTPPSDGFALGPNTSTSTRARIHVPGSSRVVDGTTVFRAGCAFTGAVLCLRMDDPPSNSETMTWDERSPVSRSVTCVGNTCPTLNESGDAWVFNSGTSKDYLTVTPDISGAFHANNTTLSLFVKPLSQSVATRPLFVSTDEHLRAELVSERPSFTYNGVTITSQSPLPIGSWAHLVFRYQDGKTSIWVNNALVAQSAAIRVMTTTSAAYMIGGTPTDASMSAIRDIQLYDTVLTPAQTRALQTGCTDALLVTCLTFDDSTTLDGSVIGQRNEVTLICGDACTTVANQTATFSTGSPLTIGNGVWLEQREFTIGLAFKPPASGTVTYLATSNPVNPLTFSAINAVPTVSVAGQSISVAAVPGGQWSYALIRYAQGKVSLSVSRVDNSTKPATVPYNPAATATSADVVIGSEVEPLWIGSNGAVIKRLTIHRVAVSDAAVSTMAQAALIDQNGRETAAPPVSDAVRVTADVRSSVVAPDINAGRKDVVCVPPTGVDLPSLCAPLFSLPPTVTNSTTASFTGAAYSQSSTFSSKLPATNAGDTNPNTYSVTGYESEPWLQIDLGSTKRIRSVTVVNRQHPTSYSLLTGAVVFLRRNGAPVGDDTTANLLASADTVAARGLMCASTSACATPPGAQHRVDFGSGYDARYVRIQLNAETSYLQIG